MTRLILLALLFVAAASAQIWDGNARRIHGRPIVCANPQSGYALSFDQSTRRWVCAAGSSPVTPGYPANQVLEGCGVEYTGTGLQFVVGECSYSINGTTYTSPITTVTLDASDPSNPRIDAIVVNTSSVATKITGTAAADPAKPTIDPTTELDLTFATVAAGATTPSDITTDAVYDENVEWTVAVTTNFTEGVKTERYTGSRSVEATTATSGNNVQFTRASTTDILRSDRLSFYICSKGAWPSGRSLTLRWQNSTNQRGSQIVLRDGTFGFSSSVSGSCGVGGSSWQQVSIPTSLFNTVGQAVDKLRVQVAGSGSTIGFWLDNIKLQRGIDNSDPEVEEGGFGITIDGGGSVITTGVKGFIQIPYSCEISGWTLLADQSGSITLDVWRDSYANAPPTVADTITASAKPLISSAAKNTSTTLTGWTKNITSGDVIGFNVDSATTITRVNAFFRCTKI